MDIDVARALTAANERRIVGAFRSHRALTARMALPLRELGLHDSRTLRDMVLGLVLRRAGPERYFLDEAVWSARRHLDLRAVKRIGWAAAAAAVVVAFVFFR
jgi:hypothetical protein